MTRDEYRNVYLQSDHWREVRTAALERADGRCQVCNGSTRLDVHHRTYERIGQEADADLTVLCRKCHDIFHATSKVKSKRTNTSRTGGPQKRNWSEMTAVEQDTLCNQLLRILALGPQTSKQAAAGLGVRTQAVGSCFVVLRRSGKVRKRNNRWVLTDAQHRPADPRETARQVTA